jgi:hypothetical protein
MGKSERAKRQSARERIAAQQAAAKKAEQRRRLLLGGGAVVVVIAIVVTLVVIKLGSGSPKNTNGSVTGTALPASVARNVTTVPDSARTAVGTGSVLSYNPHPVSAITGNALTSGGKPEMLYIGAEFCPYCAALRWSMAESLSRFGTMSPLHGIRSSSTDVNPNTATLTFYKSTYTSKYLTFTAVENETRTRGPLQDTTKQQQQIWEHYSPNGQLGYPFIDFGNKFLINGPIYDPGVLAGLSWQQISADMRDPNSPVAKGAIGAANFITAAICKTTGGQPGNVCTAPAVTQAASHLGT